MQSASQGSDTRQCLVEQEGAADAWAQELRLYSAGGCLCSRCCGISLSMAAAVTLCSSYCVTA